MSQAGDIGDAAFDVAWPDAGGRSRAPRAGRPFAKALVMGFGLVALAAAAYRFAPQPATTANQPPPALPPYWATVTRPQPVFHVQNLPADSPVLHAARSHTGKAGEEDTLVLGAFASGDHARLIMERPGPEPRRAASFVIDMVRRAGEAGVSITRAGQPSPLETRFGPAEVAQMQLSHGGVTRGCSVFRLSAPDDLLRIAGWLCAAEPVEGVDPRLRCLVESIALSAPRGDATLARLFAVSERRRDPACLRAAARAG